MREEPMLAAPPRVTASNMARWWGREPDGRIEDDRCDLGAALFRLDNDAPFGATCEADPNTHILSVHLGGDLRNEFSADGIVHFQGTHRIGDIVMIPGGQRPVAILQDAIVAEIMHLYIPDRLIRRCTVEDRGGGGAFELKDHFVRDDSETVRAAKIVREEMLRPGYASALLLDSVALALSVRMVRQWSSLGEAPATTVRGGLAPWQVRRVKSIILDRLGEPVRLDELAAAVNLSTFHFARAFRQSTGMPPHRFQTVARLAKARELLARSEMGVLHIALAVGYESGQAMARAFRREYGCAPAEFRRQVAEG